MIYLNSKLYKLIKSRRFIWIFSIVVIFYLFVTKTAYADTKCDLISNNSGKAFDLNTVRYPKGDYIEFLLEYNSVEFRCDSADVYFKVTTSSSSSQVIDRQLITSIPGVKVVLKEDQLFPTCKVDSRSDTDIIFRCINSLAYLPISGMLAIQLIKEGNISVNKEIDEEFKVTIDYYSYGEYPKSIIGHNITNVKGKIQTYDCSLNINNINFDLGEQQLRNSTNTGPVGNGRTQKIALTCDPTTKYSLQVDGDAEPGHQGVLKLSPGSSATGVGVQLLVGKNQDPVEFGKNKQMGIAASSGTNIQEEIDITARYYQTENKATPGTANATATFTMTYQ
ncbi:fimbrial protein [Yersinia proxima]|uniref:Fimbrial protein n=1 Tax=Yersinia proxima TaxID=2890316 RepID=A0ABW9ET70_9GAMM|nr:fimbrial protein [Yersinia proxima]CNL02742.1 putative fimbrial subunit [Yersinia intermedia]